MSLWFYNPRTGGVKISKTVQERTRARLVAHAAKQHPDVRIELRFKGALCYVDAYREPDARATYVPAGMTLEQAVERMRNTPSHLVRLRHFAEDRWSFAFYKYSDEKYEPTVFPSGEDFGTPEEAFDVGAMYLEE